MSHKQSKAGFTFLLVIAAMLLLGIVLSILLMHTRHHTDGSSYSSDNWQPNEISVTFKDGVTYQQASDLIKSDGLTIDNERAAETDFIPKSFRGIKKTVADQVMDKLRTYPEVKSALDDSADPANNRAAADEKWVEVIWQENVTFDRIKQIQTATGYGLSNQPQGITRSLYVSAPTGQEDYFISRLKGESIVKSANRVGAPILLQGSN